MASAKRELPEADTDEPEIKRPKISESAESSDLPKTNQRVVLNPADCNLDFNIEDNGLIGSALHEHGFAYCWSGARANVGITGGKYCFGCQIIAEQPVETEDVPFDQRHLCRLGISRGDDTVGNLGETDHSFGYGGTGKLSNAGKFSDFGERYGVGDTIVCCVILSYNSSAFIDFYKNGKWLGVAKFDARPNLVDPPLEKHQWKSAFFPHVLLKNVTVCMQFSNEDGLVPQEGYKPWASALEDGNAVMGPAFNNPRDCEVLMMVGLPASGKTTWAEKWVKEHPEKRYILLGTNLALDQMKVPGLTRKQNYGERFERLMDSATGIFNMLLNRASKTPGNYIIDQTNVYKSARKRKLKPFADYQKIAVVVFPSPEELKFRAEKRFKEMGKDVPAEAVNDMLANFVLPMSKDMPSADEYFDQIMFPELGRAESQRHLDEMKCALKSAKNLSPITKVLPYSHKSPVQSAFHSESSTPLYIGSSMQSQATLEGSGRYYGSSHQNQPLTGSTYTSHGQENTTYLGASRPARMESASGFYSDIQNSPSVRQYPYERPTSTGSYLPRDDFNSYGSYDGYHYSGRSDMGSRIPTSVDNPYPYFEGRTLTPGSTGNPYQGGGSNVYHTGGYTDISRAPPADLQMPTRPPFPCPQSTYGRSPYETPRPPPQHGRRFGPYETLSPQLPPYY